MHSPIKPRKILIFVLLLLVAIIPGGTWYLFDQTARQSERHTYTYAIDLSTTTTIDNVTLFIPVPERNTTPFFIESLLNGTAYGVSPDWKITIVHENGTPMVAIRTARIVPAYHGYPIPIEPEARLLPATLRPGTGYSSDTPVLIPFSVAVMESGTSAIETRFPVGNEPVFFPAGPFTPVSGISPALSGPVYDHPVPVYIRYTSDRPALVSLRVSVQGSNMIWNGGWQSNSYSDTVIIETANGTQGWVRGEGRLSPAEGVFY
jgi:hypothetical protein